MRFGSVCSGIEAASVAFGPLGWKAAWFAEVEPFPSAVLAHHYPETPNLGDMTAISRRVLTGEVEAPDVLCGGTPCQAFSVAGLRESLADERGNLTLKFVELADAIDHVRVTRGDEPAIVFWENVPGVLSTKDNAFGCFLAGLAGEDDPLEPPGEKWANAGCVFGPKRAIAWRVLDAQYFQLAQRRRRVFVVASARDGFDPATVLFEWDGMRRDSPPSRKAGEDAAGCLASRTDGGGFPGTDEACGGYVQPVSAFCIKGAAIGRKPEAGPQYGEVLEDICYTQNCVEQHAVACTLRGEGFDASEDGTGRGTPLVPHVVGADCYNGSLTGDVACTMGTPGSSVNASGPTVMVPIAFHPTQDPISSTDGSTHALGCGSTGGQASVAVAVAQPVADANSPPPAVFYPVRYGYHQQDTLHHEAGIMSTLPSGSNNNVGHYTATVQAMQVRRLTPVECERLQGFPDDYTNIPWTEYKRLQRRAAKAGTSYEAELRKRGKELRGKPFTGDCPDGPRYKALGNSWAVPCVAWIGRRINNALRAAA